MVCLWKFYICSSVCLWKRLTGLNKIELKACSLSSSSRFGCVVCWKLAWVKFEPLFKVSTGSRGSHWVQDCSRRFYLKICYSPFNKWYVADTVNMTSMVGCIRANIGLCQTYLLINLLISLSFHRELGLNIPWSSFNLLKPNIFTNSRAYLNFRKIKFARRLVKGD